AASTSIGPPPREVFNRHPRRGADCAVHARPRDNPAAMCAVEYVRSMPDAYTHGHHESVLRSHRWRTAENSAAYLLPHLAPGTSVLDVGSGPGTITADLAARVAPGRVVGVDASADVVSDADAD